MTDPANADPLDPARKLGETYAALLGQQEWHMDALPEGIPFAEEVAAPVGPTAPPALIHPPVAEAANDPTIPPTPLQIVEALLFVGGPPLKPEHAADAVRGLTAEQFHDCVAALNRVYRSQKRPYAVVASAEGYVLRVTPRYAGVREKLFGGPREARLNQAALDVLALVAYHQPVAAAEIDSSRGAASGAVLRQLVRLGLIASVPRDDAESKELLYGTTPRFLEVFRVRDLDDLPQLGAPKRV